MLSIHTNVNLIWEKKKLQSTPSLLYLSLHPELYKISDTQKQLLCKIALWSFGPLRVWIPWEML